MALLAHYKLDSNANDFGPKGVHLTETGSPTYTTGAINNGITLAFGKKLSANLTTEFDGVTDFTFMSRLKFSTLPNSGVTQAIFDIAETTNTTIAFTFQNSGGSYILNFTVTNATGSLAHSYNLTSNSKTWHTDGNFHEFKYKFDYTSSGTTTLTLFVDNVSITSVSTASDIKMRANPSIINFGSSSLAFDGVMDEVRFYSHVLTSAQDTLLYEHDGAIEYTINNIDYTYGHASTFGFTFGGYDIYENTIYTASELNLYVVDADRSIFDNAKRYSEIKLIVNGTTRFLGLAIDFITDNSPSNTIEIYCRDYWDTWLRSPVTSSYTAQTRSAILTDIAQNNQFLEEFSFGVSNIQSTSTSITRKYAGDTAGVIAADFAINEGFSVFIDESKNVIFRPQNFEDTGVHLNYDNGDIRDSDYSKSGEGVVNVVSVRGATGAPGATDREAISIIYEDDALIEAMGGTKVTMPEIVDASITSRLDAVNRAIYEIERRNSIPTRVKLSANLNFNLTRGKLVTLTEASEGITAQKFYILSARHVYLEQATHLELFFYSRSTIDQINDIQKNAAKAGQPMRDNSAVTTKFKVRSDDITVSALIDVASRNFSDAQYGEFDYGTKYYGQVSGSWSDSVTDESMTVTNIGIENMLRIIGQVTTVPNIFDAVYLAIGTGTSSIDFSDTTLESESLRVPINATFPRRINAAEATFEFFVDDLDVVAGSFTNVALFDASSSGNMIIAHKFASAVSKTAGNALRFTLTFSLSGGALTTDGKNLLVDLLIGQSTDYLDNSNAAIEIVKTDSSTYRDGMDTGYPNFASGNLEQLTWLSVVTTTEISDNSLGAVSFTGMDLYNKTSSGTQVTDVDVASTKINSLQNLGLQYVLKLVR